MTIPADVLSKLQTIIPEPEGEHLVGGTSLVRNVTASAYCPACGDEGYVSLAARVTVGGASYSQVAPCRWCEEGQARYRRCRSSSSHHRPFEPVSDYSYADVIPAGSQWGGRLDAAKQKRLAAAMATALRGMDSRRIR